MTKNFSVSLYGSIVLFVGVFLLLSGKTSFETVRFTLGIALCLGAGLSFLSALSLKRKQVEFAYHELHAMAMLVYGLSVLLFANKMETLISFTSFLLFFYAFSEITFCTWLFNLGRKMIHKILIIRLALGLMVGSGVVFIMSYHEAHEENTLEGFGFLFLLIGTNILLYVPIMVEKGLNKSFE